MRRLTLLSTIFLLLVLIAAAPNQPIRALETFTAQIPGSQSCAPDILQALNQISTECSAMGRNQACYGNDLVNVEYRPDVVPGSVLFTSAGDIANLVSFQRIQTTPFNPISRTWGIALMKAQVDLPDALPGQNVTFLLFGDTTVDTSSTSMRAFTVQTRIGTVVCSELPESALLIQAPENQQIRMNINGADVMLGSTARIVSHTGHDMIVSLLEGHGGVEAYGVDRELVPGSEVWMPLGGEDGTTVADAPSEVRGYDLSEMELLPLELLDRPIDLVPPIGTTNTSPDGTCTPRTDWMFTYVVHAGDSLLGIASRAQVTLQDLVTANCIDARTVIYPGQTLVTPIRVSPPSQQVTPNPASPQTPTATPVADPNVPPVAFLTAEPMTIKVGQCTDLTWGVTGGTGTVSYSNLNGLPVPLNGTRIECPTVTTQYIFIMAYTDNRASNATVTVTVDTDPSPYYTPGGS